MFADLAPVVIAYRSVDDELIPPWRKAEVEDEDRD
jgi:hypothetical protein